MKMSFLLAAMCVLSLSGCALQTSPRASLDPTPPAPQKETDPLERAREERVRQRAEEIYRAKQSDGQPSGKADDRREAERIAREELDPNSLSPYSKKR